MVRLLKIEWNKLYYYKTARMFIITYFVLMALVGFGISQFSSNINGAEINFVQLGAFDFPYVWQNVTYFVAIGKIFLAVIIITNITNEYSNRTLKQNLIDGLSKKEFLGSKMITNIAFALASTIFIFVICLVLGTYYTQGNESLFQGIEFIAAYLVKLVFFFTFCMFLAFLFKKTAFSLMLLFVWWILEKIGRIAESGIRYGILKQDIMNNSKFFTDYLPLESSSNLISFPDVEIGNYIMGGKLFTQGSVDWTFMVSTCIYTLVFVYLSYTLLQKRDL